VELDGRVRSEGGTLEIDVNGNQNVATSLATRPSGAPEQTTIPKHRPEQVIERSKVREQIADLDPVSPVVALSPLRIRQNLIGFRHITESSLGGGIIGIGIRMRFSGQPSKCLLDLFGSGIARNAESLVVVRHG
jgi:hypothetical protein